MRAWARSVRRSSRRCWGVWMPGKVTAGLREAIGQGPAGHALAGVIMNLPCSGARGRRSWGVRNCPLRGGGHSGGGQIGGARADGGGGGERRQLDRRRPVAGGGAAALRHR